MKIRFHLICIIFLFSFYSSVFASENRIISLIPSSTEMVFAIGMGKELVAVSHYCNFPADQISHLPRIGDQNLNIEKIISLKPTILVDTNSIHKRYEQLFEKLKLNYFNMEIRKPEDLPIAAKLLAAQLGNASGADVFAEMFNREISNLQIIQNNQKPKVYMEIWNNPIQCAGGNNNLNSMINIAGGQNPLAELGEFPTVNSEMLIKSNPDVIILAYPDASIPSIYERPGWKAINAVKKHNIFTINQDLIVRPSPRNIYAIRELNKIFNQVVNKYESAEKH